ncbi:MAG: hypothetical protein EHM78_00445 [Myxococcaceae bacterium]|nr:MAG: hypothetical protein EHM78_00445 [Myxococcaceae bacterium]
MLPPALESALASIPESQAVRLRQVCHGAASTLARLTDLDLLQYESPVTAASLDLSTWEEMAPVVAATLRDVNAFIDLVRTQLAAGQPSPKGNGLASLVEDAVLDDAARARLERVLESAASQLFEQVQTLGVKVREPGVVADRWNLLAEVQASRTRFREQIGTLVFDLVAPFADVERSEVVPGHADEVGGAVSVRAAVADLRRILEARAAKLRQASSEDVQWHAQHLEQEMDAFGRTAPYRSLRAQDKRRLIEYRHAVREMATQPLPAKADVMEACQRVLELVTGLAVVNQRALLVRHDHEVWARSGVRLEQAEALLAIDRRAAAVALAEAAEVAAGLYGRSDALDEFLRRARKRSLALVPAEEVGPVVEEFRALLASLPFSE